MELLMRLEMKRAVVFFFVLTIAITLLTTGCKPKDPPFKAYSDFYNAIFKGEFDTVKNLLRKYPALISWEFNVGGYQGDTLMTAAVGNHPDIIELLLKAGAEPNYYDDNGTTPLITAIYHERIDIVRQLLDAGADVEQKTNDKTSVFHILAEKYNIEIANMLFSRSKNIDQAKDGGFTPLTVALSEYHNDLAFRFIEAGADLKKALDPAPHIIPEFVINNNREMLEYFWDQGVIDPYAVYQNNNLFHYAAWYNNIEFVRDMVSRGLWDYSTNHAGETPLEIAQRMGHTEIVKLVKEAGLAKP
jgi:ankyrin repeat protein